jgi:hypothetical protein
VYQTWRHRQAVARTRVPAAKTTRVAHEEVRLLRRHARALGIGDAPVGGEGGGLAAQRQLAGLGGIDRPGMDQVQVDRCLLRGGEIGLVGKPRRRVLGGEAGDVVGGLHRLLEGGAGEVRRARVAATLPEIDGDADRLVAIAFHVLEPALAHRHRQPGAFGHFHRRVARARRAGDL